MSHTLGHYGIFAIIQFLSKHQMQFLPTIFSLIITQVVYSVLSHLSRFDNVSALLLYSFVMCQYVESSA